MSEQRTLAERINVAAKIVGELAADKKYNAAGTQYDYISANKILQRVGDALAAQGVAVIPGVTDVYPTAQDRGQNKFRYDSVVKFDMIVTDGTQTEHAPWVGHGCAFDSPDKATYKAITSGHKYFLMKLLNVGIGNEDSEHEPADETPQVQEVRTVVNLPKAAELDILRTWDSPADAKDWAVESGACSNLFEASNSFKKSVDKYGGKLNKENIADVYLDFLSHQLDKLAKRVAA